jgi:hypothetical protein
VANLFNLENNFLTGYALYVKRIGRPQKYEDYISGARLEKAVL